MLKEGKIGVTEAVCLATITMTVKVLFSSPAILMGRVGNSIWYVTLISAATALIGFSFLYLLLKRFPDKNLAEIFDLSVGRAVGILFSLIIIAALMFNTGAALREFSDVLRAYTFQGTPTGYITGACVLSVAIAAWLGWESIARIAKLAAYLLLLGYLSLLILATKDYHYDNIFPIFGYGLWNAIFIGAKRCSVYADVIVLGITAASLQGVQHIKRVGVVSITLSGVLIALGLLSQLLLFSYTAGQEDVAPIYALARIIKYGGFLSRLDPLFIFLWCTATAITKSVFLYAAVSQFCQTFRLPDKRPVIIPMALLLQALAMTPRDFPTIAYGYIETARNYGWTVFFGLPFIALIAAVGRGKKDEESNA